jgi:hypothetical protein
VVAGGAVTTLAMMTGHCTCEPCKLGDETCSRTGPCEACKATMRVGERFEAAHYLGIGAEQWDSLPRDEQLDWLAAIRTQDGGGASMPAGTGVP